MRKKPERKPVIVWFRQDLRLQDNPAVDYAARRARPILAVYIWAPGDEGRWQPGGAARWWLYHSLKSLAASLEGLGGSLLITRGCAFKEIERIATTTGAVEVYWNRSYQPELRKRDERVRERLRSIEIPVRTFNGGMLFGPGGIRTTQGRPFQVFSAFWKRCLTRDIEPVLELPPEPAFCPVPDKKHCLSVDDLGLLSGPRWHRKFEPLWRPGERFALMRLEQFLQEAIGDYATTRERPAAPGTSRLSPHLHFGELSARQVWHACLKAKQGKASESFGRNVDSFLRELGWREFAYYLLHHFPDTTEEPLKTEFEAFPWRTDSAGLQAWRKGETGFPIVDAGMRELWETGWMHNRARMITASFLVKNQLISWEKGHEWFWDTLVDADLPNNTLGWQWVAGCGSDAAPFFRIFNPVRQGERFDPDGEYVRRWIPPLARVPKQWIHCPWKAPPEELATSGVRLGKDYPLPILDLAKTRERALKAFRSLRY